MGSVSGVYYLLLKTLKCLTDTFSLTAILSSLWLLETKCGKCTFTFYQYSQWWEIVYLKFQLRICFPGTVPSSPFFMFWSLYSLCPQRLLFQFLIPCWDMLFKNCDFIKVYVSSGELKALGRKGTFYNKTSPHIFTVPREVFSTQMSKECPLGHRFLQQLRNPLWAIPSGSVVLSLVYTFELTGELKKSKHLHSLTKDSELTSLDMARTVIFF